MTPVGAPLINFLALYPRRLTRPVRDSPVAAPVGRFGEEGLCGVQAEDRAELPAVPNSLSFESVPASGTGTERASATAALSTTESGVTSGRPVPGHRTGTDVARPHGHLPAFRSLLVPHYVLRLVILGFTNRFWKDETQVTSRLRRRVRRVATAGRGWPVESGTSPGESGTFPRRPLAPPGGLC